MRFKSRKTQTNCAPNYIQNTDILITLGNKSAKNKGLECTIAYNNIESAFHNHVFYINFGINQPFFKLLFILHSFFIHGCIADLSLKGVAI